MGRPITITIDSDDLIEMFCDRVAFWSDSLNPQAQDLFCDYYAELVEDGVFDGMKDFSVANIVDNDVVNEIDVVVKEDLPEYNIDLDNDEGTDRILYSDGETFLISARG